MKRWVTIAFTLLLASSLVGIADGQSPTTAPAFDPTGGYHPQNPPQDGTDKFIQFSLRARSGGRKLSADGEVRGVQPWYKFSSIVLTRRTLKFVTVTASGIRYEFTGTFLGTGSFARQWEGTGLVMLNGTLRKYSRGKKVLEWTTPFVYYPPH